MARGKERGLAGVGGSGGGLRQSLGGAGLSGLCCKWSAHVCNAVLQLEGTRGGRSDLEQDPQ